MAWKLPFYMGVMPWQLHYLRLMHMTVMIFLWVLSACGSNCFGATVSWNQQHHVECLHYCNPAIDELYHHNGMNGCDCDVSVHGTIALTIVE